MKHELGGGKVVLFIFSVIAVPSVLTLTTIERAQNVIRPVTDSSPMGYTISLSLFVIPALAILFWLHVKHDQTIVRRTFWWALAFLIPLGFLLDMLFGLTFFTFVNHQATLEIYLPGFDWRTLSWRLALPVEEFLFYISGFVTVLLLYLWCDEYWLAAYQRSDHQTASKALSQLIVLDWRWLGVGLAMMLLAVAAKQGPGFPGYFCFLTAASFIPTALLFNSVVSFINWRAFSFTFFLIVLISLLWEATLAAPYQWWGYDQEQMLGVSINAWTSLPIEAVLVWLAVTFTSVIVYETIKIWQHSEKALLSALLGGR